MPMTIPTSQVLEATMTREAENMALSQEEFCARFVAKMTSAAGPSARSDDAIYTLAEYAAETAPTYWEDPDQRAEGPEECALSDISYWEDDGE